MNSTYATSSSITVTIDDNIVDLNVAPTAAGAFSKSSVSKIGVSTTNYTGYTLSIFTQDKDNPTALVNGDEGLFSISSAITEEQFKALDSTAYNNQWGYLPSKYNSETNTSFLPSPSTSGDILDITSTANASGEVNEYEITLGARVDSTASLGSYSNVFLVEAVANAVSYSFIYNDNVVSNVPTDLNSTTMNSNENISSNIPVRDGYTFLGWCLGTLDTTNITTTNGIDTCASTIYQPGASITIDQTGGDNDKYFYAMWSTNNPITINNLNYLQDFYLLSPSYKAMVLSSMPYEVNYTLKDSRDQQSYTIAKLKDGRLWMTSNLNLAAGVALSSYDTDVDSGYINNFTTSNNLTRSGDTIILPVSSSSGFNTANYSYVYNSENKTTSQSDCVGNRACNSYYSYDAATLGSGRNISTDNTDAAYSICPKGWHLPNTRTGINSSSDFRALMVAYGGSDTIATYNEWTTPTGSIMYGNIGPNSAPNFLSAGYYNNSWFGDGGSAGRYWSATATSNTVISHYLLFYSNSVCSDNTAGRAIGVSVRCIANN